MKTLINGCIETMLMRQSACEFLQYHQDRFAKSRSAILPEFEHNEDLLVDAIKDIYSDAPIVIRCAWDKRKPYEIHATTRPVPNSKASVRLAVHTGMLKEITNLSWIKSTDRSYFETLKMWAESQNCDDALLINEKSNCVETTISNIILQKDNVLYTPPLSDGCVNGVYRTFLMHDKTSKELIEKSFSIDDLISVDKIYCCNAVRGVYPAKLEVVI